MASRIAFWFAAAVTAGRGSTLSARNEK